MAIKKGQAEIGVATFTIFGFIVMMFTISIILTTLQTSKVADKYDVANKTITKGISMFSAMDNSIPFVIFGVNIVAMMTMFFLASEPIFFWISLITIPLTIFINASISNAYATSLATLTIASSFPITTFFMSNLPLIMFGTDILGIIILYSIFR